ncbi:MAG: OsmC family protein [Calditrichaeota bacterium]|nr:OsmC family protein [Calditrichota bacterium]
MVKMDFKYLGDLKIETLHEPSGSQLKSAAPVDNNGDGSSFSPTDLLATATTTCMITLMGIHANRHGIDISGLTASTEKHMANQPRRVEKLKITMHIPRNLDNKSRDILWEAAINCPVAKSIHPDLKIDLQVNYTE